MVDSLARASGDDKVQSPAVTDIPASATAVA
jgi:hypothetical protein